MKQLLNALIGSTLAFSATPVFALDWQLNAHVRSVEGTYMPGFVRFTVDVASGTCAAGSPLQYYATGSTDADQIANTESALSILLTAKATGAMIAYGGNNSGCVVTYVIGQ